MPVAIIDTDLKCEICSSFRVLLDRFEEELSIQTNKYPLSEREQLFATYLKKTLELMDDHIMVNLR